MTILKKQIFDTFIFEQSIIETMAIMIDELGRCFVETESFAKDRSLQIFRRSEIREEMKKFYYPTVRGDYRIYLIRSKDALRFAKWKNNKLVEKHKWKISDYI